METVGLPCSTLETVRRVIVALSVMFCTDRCHKRTMRRLCYGMVMVLIVNMGINKTMLLCYKTEQILAKKLRI